MTKKHLNEIKLNPMADAATLRSAPATPLAPIDKAQAKARFNAFLDALNGEQRAEFDALVKANDGLIKFLSAAFDLSPYVHDLAQKHPQTILALAENSFSHVLDNVLGECAPLTADCDETANMLREVKQKAALIIALADLGGWWTALDVGHAMAMLADATLVRAVNTLLLNAHERGKLKLPDVETPSAGCGLTVLAMGKHGADELNYSSDVDLIVLIDPDSPAVQDRDEAVTLFVRLTKQLVQMMQERTAYGYVFRTDLRLRPDPGSMPLAIPIDLALRYYESRGQNWERAAMIKSRPVAGDLKLGQAFLDELQPFIWRRYLDYAAIADIHSIKRQIQSHKGLTAISTAGHNVKLGRGGIREIEFFVQTQQLIAGGRVPELRGKKTTAMLLKFADQGWISQQAADELIVDYCFLRDVEHRLQIISDSQTHTLPTEKDDLARVAALCGFSSVKKFDAALIGHLHNVERHYASLFETAPGLAGEGGNLSFTGDDDDPGTLDALEALGFERPSAAIDIVRSWHYGRYPAMQSSDARERLTEMTPALLKALSGTGKPQDALLAFDEFLKGLPAGFQLFALLSTNPQLLGLLVQILGTAPEQARIITRRPHVFDGLLEPGFFQTLPTITFYCEALSRTLAQSISYEDGLDRARIFAAEQRFLIGIRLLSGAQDALQAGEMFSDLAQAVLATMIDYVSEPFIANHGTVPGANIAVLALGNFGSKTLTASSDLDLVLVYEFAPEKDYSDGRKPLHASQYFGRLAQRLIAAMSAPTAEGVIYELDFRLRPAGQAGPIATSLKAFEAYYADNAWTWELLALARGRVVYGGDAFSAKVEAAISTIMQAERSLKQLAKDTLDMRLTLDKEHPPRSKWHVKRFKGGLMDVEFLQQFQRLANQDGLAERLANDELRNDNVTLEEARSTYLRVNQMLRLCLGNSIPLEEAPQGLMVEMLRHLDLPDQNIAESHLADMQKAVRELFLTVMKKFTAQKQ